MNTTPRVITLSPI